MADIEFQTEQIEALLRKAASIAEPGVFRALVKRAAAKVGEKGVELSGGYPPQSGRTLLEVYGADEDVYREKLRNFFGLLKAGRIQVPYRRTGQLGRSITYEVQELGDADNTTEISIGTNLDYAPPVIGDPEEQSLYHMGTWPSLVETITDNAPALLTVFEQQFGEDLEAWWKRDA